MAARRGAALHVGVGCDPAALADALQFTVPAEITAISAALGFSGIWFLNGSYQWGCTSYARDDEVPWLVRTLDWPFPGLGKQVEVAHTAGSAGDYYSVTWPGFVGVLTAMAPGRFAAAI